MQCVNCPLVNPPCAAGVGNPHAKIAIVGRNPGRVEARTGEAFTGPSGQLLDAILEEVGLKREDLWITNAVSCHVESDDGPSKEMYDLCRPRLFDELTKVDPQVILTLGNEATHSLLGWDAGSIMSLIGSMHQLFELGPWVIPTFHPAYILRGALDGYEDLRDAIERAAGLVSGERPFPEPLPYDRVHYLNSRLAVSEYLSGLALQKNTVLAIDTETNFVRDPNYEILLLQFGDGKDAWVIEAKYVTDPREISHELLREIFEDPSRTWIFHNAAFDLRYIRHYWGEIAGRVEDTMALALCLNEKLRYAGLKRLVNSYLSVPHYEQSLAKYITSKKTGYSAIPREVLVPYAGFDVIFTYRLFPVLMKRVEKEGNLHNLYPLLVEVQKLFSEMTYHGTLVDLTYIDKLKEEYNPLREQLEKEMQAVAWGMGFRATEVVKGADDWPFLNVNSPKQLKYFLNEYYGMNTETTDAKFMEKNLDHEFIQRLDQYRKVDHLMKAYVEGLEGELWPDGRVHPDFVHGTVTGRVTIEHPALQTIPGDDFTKKFKLRSVRQLFTVPKGSWFMHADYSQLEIRVAWHLTGDKDLGTAVMSKDLHRTMAAMIYHKEPEDITDYERSRSKLVTFGMLYGRQAPSLAQGLKCSVQEAQAFLDRFAARFPVYFGWWKGRIDAALEEGLLTTEFGRRRRWSIITPELARTISNQAVNFPVQSTASDICLSSLVKLNKILKLNGWGRALFSVHDSVELEIRDGFVDVVQPTIHEIMEHPFENTCAVFKVKIGVGKNFAEASSD